MGEPEPSNIYRLLETAFDWLAGLPPLRWLNWLMR